LPRRRGQFKGEKRRKELNRLQKQEEKRQRRFGNVQPEKEPGAPETNASETEAGTQKQEGEESPTPITAQP
jgi:hypothetical protein